MTIPKQANPDKPITPETETSAESDLLEAKAKTKDKAMSSRIERLRAYLTLNKIFFETITATALTLMAIILAGAQLWITQKQTTYLQQQIIIEREQALPQFVLLTKTFANENTGNHEDDRILVYNQGNIALNIKTETAVFFDLKYTNGVDFQNVLVPVDGYYWWHVISGDATGLVVTIEQTGNNLKRSVIQDELDKMTKAKNGIINLEVKRYLKLTFRDIFNDIHIEYYLVMPFSGGELLSEDEGKAIFDQHWKGVTDGTMFDMDRNTAQDLYNLFP